MTRLLVENLGKRYWIPKPQQTRVNPTRFERLRRALSIPLARQLDAREFWALQDVSFGVEPGSVLGVIGNNGAGKTTLLKVIARVISPTEGRVSGQGRVVSLLELGAGFDDEVSARENVYMNAALNGIPKPVVERRLEDILEFAEVQAFADQTLQHYSSGMYLRLAFSVAINMEPSILLADEILAVGDMAFQERCLVKVRELARTTGLTVLFVSHDMEAVSRICDRVIWIKEGRLHRDGDPDEVVTEYQNAAWELLTSAAQTGYKGTDQAGRYGEILEVKLLSADGREIGSPPRSADVLVRIRFRTHGVRVRGRCVFDLYSKGVLVFRSQQPDIVQLPANTTHEAIARIPARTLSETAYSISAGVTLIRGEGEEHPLLVQKALAFMVYGDGEGERRRGAGTSRHGLMSPELEWSLQSDPHVINV